MKAERWAGWSTVWRPRLCPAHVLLVKKFPEESDLGHSIRHARCSERFARTDLEVILLQSFGFFQKLGDCFQELLKHSLNKYFLNAFYVIVAAEAVV